MNNSKELRFSKNARESMIRGIDRLADSVKVTIGPKGRNVILEQESGPPIVTNDGVSIAREIILKDTFENIGARLLAEVASSTNESAGDGTTTAILLAQSMIHRGLNMINKGVNPVLMREGMDYAGKQIVLDLIRQSLPVQTREEISAVASVSSGSDTIGELIADAVESVGNDGLIFVDESKSFETSLEINLGYRYDRGYLMVERINDPEHQCIRLRNTFVLVYYGHLHSLYKLTGLLNQLSASNRPLLIIASQIDDLVIDELMSYPKNLVYVTKSPGLNMYAKDSMEDICAITHTRLFDEHTSLEDLTFIDLGQAKNVIIEALQTTIAIDYKQIAMFDRHIRSLQTKMEESNHPTEQQIIQDRISRLGHKVAFIKVGSLSEANLKEQKARINDALNSTRAAIEEGVVKGGGTALVQAYKSIKNVVHSDNPDINAGIEVVLDSIPDPLFQIAENAGYNGKEIMNEILTRDDDKGFDARNGRWANFIEEGIIDPTIVTRSALLNAVNISGLFLTTEVAVGIRKDD